ncbi:beta strand repeat-containing protein, partial [Nostoc sp.]|uniref:beta strand repeat-containing protein n=1 Tax=Nostoc sp. TaxID=1180 RepID=UPI002FF76805
ITAGTNRVSYKSIERLNISGTFLNDNIVGNDGNDTLSGGDGGNDTIDGGIGDDLLTVRFGDPGGGINSTFNATTNIGSITAGTNRVSYKSIERLNISGTFLNDNIVGNDSNDTLSGGDGGNDTINGGIGEDLLTVRFGNPTRGITTTFNATTNIGLITAGTEDRVSYKNIEQLNISGTSLNDNIVGSNGNDTLSAGDELYSNYGGNDTLNGGAGNDYLSAKFSDGNNLVDGGDGNDTLFAYGEYNDYQGNFSLFAISGNNTFNGGAGDDNLVINYSSGNNLLNGDNGNDTLTVSGSASLYSLYEVYTVSGNNTLNGGAGNDRLIVDYSLGANLLSGGDGNDTLTASGASGNNALIGGNGNDYLTGGNGNDSLVGGTGPDTFAFNSYNEGVDSIYNFNATNEIIQVSAASFGGGLSIGTLETSQFTIGTSATAIAQRFIYNSATGGLFFDQDGSASGFTQVKFAQLSAGLSLTENNFVLV